MADDNQMQLDITPLRGVFSSIQTSLDSQTAILKEMVEGQKEQAKILQRQKSLQDVSSTSSLRSSLTGSGSGLGGGAANLGGNLLGGGLKSAAGLAAFGFALPAFFGGLLAGETALEGARDWLGGNWDFNTLGDAMEGFSGLISRTTPAALTTLAGIMAVSGFSRNPLNGAMGLAAMGAAIPAFFGGLVLGETLLSGVKWLGADFNFTAIGEALEGFSGMIGRLTPAAGTALAALVGGTAVLSLRNHNPLNVAGMAVALGAAIPALMGGLIIGNTVLQGADWLGADFNFAQLGNAFQGFSGAIDKLTPEAATALAALVGASGLAARFGGGGMTALNTAAIMSGIGAGISGFMVGLQAGDATLSWIQNASGSTGQGMVAAFQMFNDSVGVLSRPAMIAFGSILGIGTTIGALTGSAGGVTALLAAGGIFAVMSGIGAGISGFMIGLQAGDSALTWVQNATGSSGQGMVSVFRMFNDMILAISPEAIDRMSLIKTSGAGTGLQQLALGLLGFLTAEGMSGIGNLLEPIKDGLLGAVDFLFGTSYAENANKSIIEQILDGIGPLEGIQDKIASMDAFSSALVRFTESFSGLANLNTDNISTGLARRLADIGGVLQVLPNLINGGTFYGDDSNLLSRSLGTGRGEINFGGGLRALASEDLEVLRTGVQSLYDVLSPNNGPTSPSAPAGEAGSQNTALEALMAATAASAAQAAQAASAAAASAAIAASRSGGSVVNNVSTTNITSDPIRSLDPALPGPR